MIYFLMDILFKFNLAFFDDDQNIVSNRRIIRNRYLQPKNFWVDLFISFPYPSFELTNFLGPLRLLRLTRINQVRSILAEMEDKLIKSKKVNTLVRMVKVLAITMITAHIGACLVYLFGRREAWYENDGWLVAKELTQNALTNKYFNSLYWAMTTITTVGYGDLCVITLKERAYAIIYMIIAGAVFSVVLGSVCDIIQNMYGEDAEYEESMSQMSQYMKQKNLNDDLQERVKKYMNYNHNTAKQDGKDSSNLLNLLTEQLRATIQTHIYKEVILTC